jgi:hypothetical protein
MVRRSSAVGFAGQSVTATLKLFQERGETFRDRLVDGIVPGPEPLPDFPQPWPSSQDVPTWPKNTKGRAKGTWPSARPFPLPHPEGAEVDSPDLA